jgi:F-type H+-transporting ATPase subunit epsilon
MNVHELHLTIATPLALLVDAQGVVALRAEDESGSFGIRPAHADLLTVLMPSVVQWRTASGASGLCAVDGGVLRVSHGNRISIACREAILGDSIEQLEVQVRAVRARQLDATRRARVEQVRMHAHAVRQLLRYLRPGYVAEPGAPRAGRSPRDMQ